MKPSFLVIVFVCLQVGVVGCGPVSLFDDGVDVEAFRAVDGVKLIDANIENPRDQRTFGQGQYSIGPTQRVLVRFLNMTDLVARIRTQDGPVSLEITLVDPNQKEDALNHIQVHPLIRDWSMLATWTRIVPWGGAEGAWLNSGGDFETTKVYSASPQKPVYPTRERVNTVVPASNDGLFFDVTHWYVNYPKGKAQFFGLIIVSDVSYQIYGDQGSEGPKLHFVE